MNDSPKSDLPEFERQLRQMVPASQDDLAEDTFYRAGWAAAEQHFKSLAAGKVSSSGRVQKSLWLQSIIFSSGLAAGLLIWAVTVSTSSGVPREDSLAIGSTDSKSNREPRTELVESDSSTVPVPSSSAVPPLSVSMVPPLSSSVVPAPRMGLLSILVDDFWPWHEMSRSLPIDVDSSMRPTLSRAEWSRWSEMSASNVSSRRPSELGRSAGTTETMLRTSTLFQSSFEDLL